MFGRGCAISPARDLAEHEVFQARKHRSAAEMAEEVEIVAVLGQLDLEELEIGCVQDRQLSQDQESVNPEVGRLVRRG